MLHSKKIESVTVHIKLRNNADLGNLYITVYDCTLAFKNDPANIMRENVHLYFTRGKLTIVFGQNNFQLKKQNILYKFME